MLLDIRLTVSNRSCWLVYSFALPVVCFGSGTSTYRRGPEATTFEKQRSLLSISTKSRRLLTMLAGRQGTLTQDQNALRDVTTRLGMEADDDGNVQRYGGGDEDNCHGHPIMRVLRKL